MLLSLRRRLRAMIRDERGVSAVEFALIAPVLVAFYFGLAEACQAYMAQKRMGHATAMVADLTAQEGTVDPTLLGDFFAIGGLIMKPYSATPLQLRVTSVTKDSTGVAKVDWSLGKGMAPLEQGEVVAVPAGIIDNGQSVVMSEADYAYDSPVNYVIRDITHFRHAYYLRPRTSEKTECPTCPAT